MKIRRKSWHYRWRAWALESAGFDMLIEPAYSDINALIYIADILFFAVPASIFAPLIRLLRMIGNRTTIEFHDCKEEQ